jgi:hypothetical protein
MNIYIGPLICQIKNIYYINGRFFEIGNHSFEMSIEQGNEILT